MEYTDDITIDAPRDRVFEALADVRRWADWMPEAASVTLKGEDRLPQAGDEFTVRRKGWFGDTWVLEKSEPTARVAARSGSYLLSYALDDAPAGGVTVRSTLESGGLMGKIEGALHSGSVAGELSAELRGLKAYCERG